MFKTNSRKGIASAAVAALAFAGLVVSAPAQAAVGLNVEPEAGSTYVVPVTDRIDIKVYTDGIPTSLIGNLKFKVENDGGHSVKYQTATSSGVATTTEVLGTASTSAVISSVTTSPGLPTVLSLDLATANLDLSSASETVTVTAWIDADSDGLADDTYVAAPVVVTFLDGDSITWTNTFATPSLGASSITAYLSTSDVNMLEMNDVPTFKFTEGSTQSNAVSAAYNTTAGKFKATATSASWTANTTSGTLQAATSSGIVSALVYKADAFIGSDDLGVTITRTVGATGVAQINGVSTSATTTNTKEISDRVTISPTATSIKVTAEAWTGSAGVEKETVTFTIAETSAASMDSGATLTVGSTVVKFTNTGVQTTDGEFSAVTDEDGIATLDIAIAGAKTGNAFTIVASIPGVNATTAVTYTFLTNGAGSVAVLDMVDTSTLQPVLNGIAKDTAFALNFAVLDTYGALLVGGNHQVRLSSGVQTVSAAVVDGKATVTWPGFASVGDKTIDVQVLKNGAAVAGATQDLLVKVGTAGVPAAVSQTATALGTALVPTLSLTTKVWADADTRLGQNPTASLNGGKELAGVVTDAAGNAVSGAVVTLTGAGLNFNVGNTVYSTGTATIRANASGQYAVTVYSTTSGKKTVAIASGAATKSVDLYYVGTAATAGTALSITSNAVGGKIEPGTTLRVTVKLTDAAGNPVQADNANAEDFSVTITGPGFVSSQPTTTNANGEALISILLGSKDSGDVVITASYDRDGKVGTTYAAITSTATITVGAVAATPSADQKLTVGTFNGYIAIYAKGYAGQKLSAKVAGKWLTVEELTSFQRVVRKTGAGYSIKVDLYIDGVFAQTSTTVTK